MGNSAYGRTLCPLPFFLKPRMKIPLRSMSFMCQEQNIPIPGNWYNPIKLHGLSKLPLASFSFLFIFPNKSSQFTTPKPFSFLLSHLYNSLFWVVVVAMLIQWYMCPTYLRASLSFMAAAFTVSIQIKLTHFSPVNFSFFLLKSLGFISEHFKTGWKDPTLWCTVPQAIEMHLLERVTWHKEFKVTSLDSGKKWQKLWLESFLNKRKTTVRDRSFSIWEAALLPSNNPKLKHWRMSQVSGRLTLLWE